MTNEQMEIIKSVKFAVLKELLKIAGNDNPEVKAFLKYVEKGWRESDEV